MRAIAVILIILAVLCVLYLLAIMPRMSGKADAGAFDTKLFAHRGLHSNGTDHPENSLRAFAGAVNAGYGIELDVQMSKDHIPMVMHDFTLKRACGVEGKVCDYTCEELQKMKLFGSDQTVPTFDEFLEVVDGKVSLIIELKVEKYDLSVCQAVQDRLKDYKGTYCIESFNPMVVRWYKKNYPSIMRGQLSDGFMGDKEMRRFPSILLMFVLEHLMLNFLTKPDFVAYNHLYEKSLSRRLCHGLYRNKAAAWTIKSQGQLENAEKHFDVFIFDSFIPKEKS